ncbi:MAG: hypothetical protein QOF24_428 [Verrucomicrobiota bacterium]|jgi:GT2 family glycosyltransferase
MSARLLVGIVTHNRSDSIATAIPLVRAQDFRPLRIAVVDDGSTDETSNVKDEFPGVSWTRWENNRGLVPARNFLMDSASEEYFASLDDDAHFLKGDELSVAVAHLDENKQVAAVAFDILSTDRPRPVERSGAQPVAIFIGCGHVLRLAHAREAGLYAVSPGGYGGEEKDLCLRLMDAGYRIHRLPGVHVWHAKSPVARDVPDQHRSGVCNDLAMTMRRTPLLLLPVALLAKLARHLSFAMRRSLLKPFAQGVLMFVTSIPILLRSRRPVRTATLRNFVRLSRAGSR